ncbi:MAG: hypothetical protein KF855_15680 [Acidobacteria bacterium]|nr:hypothetical protein [Acidobacteriota bacterium]
MMKYLAAALFAIAAIASTGIAQTDEYPDNWCRTGLFPKETDNFRVGTAKGERNSRIYFYNDFAADDCPDNEKCRKKAYIVPGDQVVISKSRGDFGCAWFAPAKGLPTVGWVRMESFAILEGPFDIPDGEWIGEWKNGENTISFTHNKLDGWLNVTGDAYWKGVGDNIHIGELDNRAEPRNGVLEYSDGDDEYDCKATMRLIGDFLIVADNMHCGGANVSFSGVYIRTKK